MLSNLPISILKLRIADQKNREAELEASKLQKLNTISNAAIHNGYDSSFESFNDHHDFPIMNQRRASSKSSVIEEEILERIQTDGPKRENDKNVPVMKINSSVPVKSSIRQLLNEAVETVPAAIKKASQPIVQGSKETPSLALKDAHLKFKLVGGKINPLIL